MFFLVIGGAFFNIVFVFSNKFAMKFIMAKIRKRQVEIQISSYGSVDIKLNKLAGAGWVDNKKDGELHYGDMPSKLYFPGLGVGFISIPTSFKYIDSKAVPLILIAQRGGFKDSKELCDILQEDGGADKAVKAINKKLELPDNQKLTVLDFQPLFEWLKSLNPATLYYLIDRKIGVEKTKLQAYLERRMMAGFGKKSNTALAIFVLLITVVVAVLLLPMIMGGGFPSSGGNVTIPSWLLPP